MDNLKILLKKKQVKTQIADSNVEDGSNLRIKSKEDFFFEKRKNPKLSRKTNKNEPSKNIKEETKQGNSKLIARYQ